MEEIEDSVVVGQEWQNDSRVILFVKMKSGYVLTDELQQRIRKKIRGLTPPPGMFRQKIIEAPDILYTLNMKKVELAVQKR